jgi:Tfp pilus assembly protein PilF
MKSILGIALVIVAASPAYARDVEIEYPAGALGYKALITEDYSTAAKQLKASVAAENDPARLINYGYVLAKMGDRDAAAKQFKRAMSVDNVELIVADGRTVDSQSLARQALDALRSDSLGK